MYGTSEQHVAGVGWGRWSQDSKINQREPFLTLEGENTLITKKRWKSQSFNISLVVIE